MGAHAGIQKLGAVYISLSPCLPSQYSSKINNIFLALLFNSTVRKDFGNQIIFNKLIEEIIFLETIGVDIVVDNKNYKLYFSLTLIVGDNLGLHSILGFSESFMTNFPCRFCKTSKADCNILRIILSCFHLRHSVHNCLYLSLKKHLIYKILSHLN